MLPSMRRFLDRYFKISENCTSIRTEMVGGLTTFLAMAYIIFVNPAMISQTGIDFGSAFVATCLAAAFATTLMGLLANYPIALAPGMGENAFFTYTVCITMGIPWTVALGCVFIEGIAFVILTATKIRQAIVESIPASLRYASACGIGLLIAFVGLIDSGLVAGHPATLVTLGKVTSVPCMLAVFGLVLTTVFLTKNIKGAILWGIVATAAFGVLLHAVRFEGIVSAPPSIAPTFFKMDLAGALRLNLLTVIFIFLFMDVFDTVGTFAGVAEVGGFMKGGKMPRIGRAMMADAIGTCAGSVLGTPTVTSYVESATGIASGAKTGLASVVTGSLFLLTLFFSPLVKMIGGGFQSESGFLLHPVTAPALIAVGVLMFRPALKIDWADMTEAVPAFLTLLLIPLSFSIASGVAIGFVAYAAIKLVSGRGRDVSPLVYVLAALFVLRFIYLQAK